LLRYDKSYALRDDRLYLLFPPELSFDIRYLEGSRWHNDLKVWSGPASWRYLQALDSLGFTPRNQETDLYRMYVQDLALRGTTSWATPTYETAGKVLFPFQNQGVTFLGQRDFALLYDEQGVGKTLQALAWAEEDPRALVICPKVVNDQWADLIRTMGKAVVTQPKGLIPWDAWGVTNYERLKGLNFHKDLTLIVDECHYIKNPKAQRSKLVLEHGRTANRILAVSGTPFVNRPVELWPIYELLRQRRHNEKWGFVQRYCGAHQDDFGHWDFSGATHLDELKDDMLHFALRRTKAEVLKDLPPKRYTTLRVQVSKGEQDEIYQRDREIFELLGQGYGAYSHESLGALQRLRVHSANAKVAGLEEYLRGHFESDGGPVVVFGGFKDALYRICDTFNGVMYTGDQSDSERRDALHGFCNGQASTICLTFGAGGVGLDGLQRVSDTVILLDLPWTPLESAQAEDRVHRQGQLGSVNVISVWSGSKVEEIILRARDKKMDVLSYLMEM
jgi:SWI/SNF-related matrix-associated actin-dependent regulator 1 of chromatin subfamily A